MAANKLDKTLADYVAIAISPALIIALVGSLMFFLLETAYSGGYEERLTWIMGCFVVAIVLISRIAIEEGAERAGVFGIALSIAVGLAIMRFVEGNPLGAFLVMGIVWWSAHKLTHDCTLIDESEDASGEGLLQAAGLDDEPAAGRAGSVSDRSNEPLAKPADPADQSLWRRIFGRNRRGSAPGLWVVYFSLAALPLFGLGQRWVPASDLPARRYVFMLLCVYVASALGLLLTTSFLGLRRYLRQRKLQMPPAMTGMWLGMGAALVAALLLVCLIVPRPSAEYAISSVTGRVEDGRASDYAVLRDSAQQGSGTPGSSEQSSPPGSSEDGSSSSGQQDQSQNQGASDEGGSQGSGGKQGSSSQNGQQQDKSGSGQGQGKGGGSGKSGSGSQSGKQGPQGQAGKQGQSSGQSGQKGEQGQKTQAGQQGKPGERSQPSEQQQADQQQSNDQSQSDPSQQSESQSEPQQAESPSSWQMPSLSEGLFMLGRWILNLVLLAVVIYLVIRYWRNIVTGFQQLLASWRAFWQSLFGGKRTETTTAAVDQPIARGPPPFAAFPNPFLRPVSGVASPEELVSYSFQALQAWAAEHGQERRPEETPFEFVTRLGDAQPHVAVAARDLAGLYARAAYAGRRLPPSAVDATRRFWECLSSATPHAATAG